MASADREDSGKNAADCSARGTRNGRRTQRDPFIPVNPEVLKWAVERSGISREYLLKRFEKLPEWERGMLNPTYNQMHRLADTIHVPSGYLLMSKPPDEELPMKDLRFFGDGKSRHNSPNLIETIYSCEIRQSWYHDYSKDSDEAKPTFIGSAGIETPPENIADRMREVLRLDVRTLLNCKTKEKAKQLLIKKMDMAGVLVMTSGVVGNNNWRSLCPKEFRGFTLSDCYAPVIFVNLNTTTSEQLFTLVNKFAHIWIDSSVISRSQNVKEGKLSKIDNWCTKVANQFLHPTEKPFYPVRPRNTHVSRLRTQYSRRPPSVAFMSSLNSSLPDASPRRSYAENIDRLRLEGFVDGNNRISTEEKKDLRGFYRALISRVSMRFARAVVSTCLNGDALYQDAYEMLGISSKEQLMKIHRCIGMIQ